MPLRLIATSLLCLGTPSPSSVAVTPPGHRNCVVCGWHFESRLLRFSTRDCSVSPLDTLPVIHLPTNRNGFINAVSPAQLPPASKTNAICVGLTSVPRHQSLPSRCRVSPPPISSISKSIPCHLFNCWVIIAVHVITQRCRHRYDTGSSRSLVGGPFQTPDNASTLLVSSGTSSSQKSRHSPKVVG